MPKRILKTQAIILCLTGLSMIIAGCGLFGKGGKKVSETRTVMGTIVRVDICAGQAEKKALESAYSDMWQRVQDVSARMDVDGAMSDVARINDSELVPVIIKPDTYHVLEKALAYTGMTNGAFDVTVGSLIDLWKNAEAANKIPLSQDILAARASVGADKLRLLNGKIAQRRHTGTKVNLGAIAKGYAIDEAARILRSHGLTQFFIDAGGDVYAGGQNCRGRPWRIGIRDPREPSSIVDVVHVSDKAVTTSGDYERYYEIAGMRWSHIIDPLTGFPQKEVISASVIADTALEADALATALCVMGGEKGTAFVDDHLTGIASLIMIQQGPENFIKQESKEYKKFKARR